MIAEIAEVVAVDRLVDEQVLRERNEHVGMGAEDLLALERGLVKDALDLFVDDGGGLLGIALRLAEVAADEDAVSRRIEADGAETVAHAVHGDHVAHDLRRLLDIAGCAGGDIVKEDLFGNASAERHNDVLKHLAARAEALVILRAEEREAAGLSAGDDGDILHGIDVLKIVRGDGVAGFVVCGQAAILFGDNAGLFLRPHGHLEDGVVDILLHDEPALAAHREQRGLVEHVLQIRAGEAGRSLGDVVQIDVLAERLAAGVDLQNVGTALDIGQADVHLPVEAAGAEERVIENVGAVCRRHDDDALIIVEAVHFDEQLVERLLALVVTAAETGAALTADGVDLVDEHDGGGDLLGLLEQVADAARADADVQLDEIGAGDGQKLDARLAGDRLGEQRFARARRADEQHALGDARAHLGIRRGIFQIFDDLLQLFLFLIGARNVGKRLFLLFLAAETGARLGELHNAAGAAALCRAHHGVPENAHDGEDDEIRHKAQPPGRLPRGRIVVLGENAFGLLLLHEIVEIVVEDAEAAALVRILRLPLVGGAQLHGEIAVGVDGEGFDLLRLKKLDDFRIDKRFLRGASRHGIDRAEQQHEDQYEKTDLTGLVGGGSVVQKLSLPFLPSRRTARTIIYI